MLSNADSASYHLFSGRRTAATGACVSWFGTLPPLLREAEAAHLVCLKPLTLLSWRQSGRGPCFERLGRSIRYPTEAFLNWVFIGRIEPITAYSIRSEHITPCAMLTESAVARELSVEVRTLQEWRYKRRELAFFRIGSDSVRYTQTDLIAYRSSRRHTNTGQYS